jgi:hypothetical protein
VLRGGICDYHASVLHAVRLSDPRQVVLLGLVAGQSTRAVMCIQPGVTGRNQSRNPAELPQTCCAEAADVPE